MLSRDTYLRALRHDGHAFADASRDALDRAVDGCPGWVIRDLVIHITEVHAFWNFIALTGMSGPDKYERPADVPETELVATFLEGLDALMETLTSSDEASSCWTWDGPHDIAWISRRMAQEMAVHAWDARTAIGDRTPIDASLASDGIDEFVHMMMRYPMPDSLSLAGSVHLHCIDVDGEWLIVPHGDELTITREHAKGSCAMRGTAHNLLMVLWRRYDLTDVEVIGDAAIAAQFVSRADLR